MWHIRFTSELWFTPSLRSIDIIVIVMWESTSDKESAHVASYLNFGILSYLYWYLVVWSCYLNIYLFWWRTNDHETNLKKEPDPIRKACHYWWLITKGNVLNWTLLEYRLNWPAVIHALSGTYTLAILWLGEAINANGYLIDSTWEPSSWRPKLLWTNPSNQLREVWIYTVDTSMDTG